MKFFSDFIGIYKKYYNGQITYREFHDFFLLKENFIIAYLFFLATLGVWTVVFSLRIELVIMGFIFINIFVLYRFLLLKGINKFVITFFIGITYMTLAVVAMLIVAYLDNH